MDYEALTRKSIKVFTLVAKCFVHRPQHSRHFLLVIEAYRNALEIIAIMGISGDQFMK